MADVALGPATLRALAAELDARADEVARSCRCERCEEGREAWLRLATDYRQRAIAAELAAAAARGAGNPHDKEARR